METKDKKYSINEIASVAITLESIRNAAERISPYINITPIFTCSTLNAITGANLYFKCENFQKSGSFKFRGACNAVFALSDDIVKHGVATHSSGNHGQALALAAKKRGVPAYIVMPENSPQVKIQAVKGYGAKITFCKPGINARESALLKIIDETKATYISPYDNEFIIAGQGTAALEIIESFDQPLDILITPVGGGGLIAGTSIVISSLKPNVKVIGAEPEVANDTYLSFKQKSIVTILHHPHSICDGLLVPLGKLTAPIIFAKVDNIFTAKEATIVKAVQYIWERMKIIAEPSAAITLAIILENPTYFAGKNIGLILSGGNVDIKAIADLF